MSSGPCCAVAADRPRPHHHEQPLGSSTTRCFSTTGTFPTWRLSTFGLPTIRIAAAALVTFAFTFAFALVLANGNDPRRDNEGLEEFYRHVFRE